MLPVEYFHSSHAFLNVKFHQNHKTVEKMRSNVTIPVLGNIARFKTVASVCLNQWGMMLGVASCCRICGPVMSRSGIVFWARHEERL